LALFRIVFYLGLMLHFFPSFAYLDELYGAQRLASVNWSPTLSSRLGSVHRAPVWVLPTIASVACLAGLLGLRPRLVAFVAGVSLYLITLRSSLATQTLALSYAWFVLWTWTLFGGGSEAWSIERWIGKRRAPRDHARGAALTGPIIVVHLMIALFFSGVEKLASGWLEENAMGRFLILPESTMLRSWAVTAFKDWHLALGWLGSWSIPVLELALPILVLFQRLRLLCAALLALFFLAVLSVFQVPPLFAFIYWGGCALLLPDWLWSRAAGMITPRRVPKSPDRSHHPTSSPSI
jgi:hypothetical protein